MTRFNDSISGSPEYMRHIATAVAKTLNLKLTTPSPILLARDETSHCKTVHGGVKGYDPTHLYYLVTYSESTYSYCLAVYALATSAVDKEKIVNLSPDDEHNYGQSFTSPVSVVPIGHSAETFSAAYLSSLLHWNSEPQQYLKTAFPNMQRVPATAVGLPGGEEINVNFLELRPEIAKRHNLTNFLLLNGIGLASLLFCIFLIRLWSFYKVISKDCAAYGQTITWFEFLLQNPDRLLAEAREPYEHKQRELQAAQEQSRTESKAQAILRHWKGEIRTKLQALLNSPFLDAEKQRIQASLDKDDAEEMKALAEELQNLHPQKSAEDRLNSLLETLKEYCDASEFSHYQQEAFQTLHDQGFREAREFIVKVHAENCDFEPESRRPPDDNAKDVDVPIGEKSTWLPSKCSQPEWDLAVLYWFWQTRPLLI